MQFFPFPFPFAKFVPKNTPKMYQNVPKLRTLEQWPDKDGQNMAHICPKWATMACIGWNAEKRPEVTLKFPKFPWRVIKDCPGNQRGKRRRFLIYSPPPICNLMFFICSLMSPNRRKRIVFAFSVCASHVLHIFLAKCHITRFLYLSTYCCCQTDFFALFKQTSIEWIQCQNPKIFSSIGMMKVLSFIQERSESNSPQWRYTHFCMGVCIWVHRHKFKF